MREYGSVPNFASGAYAVLVVSHVTSVYTKGNEDGGDQAAEECSGARYCSFYPDVT
jgi:hypothetical protein